MNQVRDSSASREAWSARYEQLRAGWLSHELTWGQALLIRQGMAAWVKAWSEAEPSRTPAQSASTLAEPHSSPSVFMGGELQRQLACELAQLILHHQQEILA